MNQSLSVPPLPTAAVSDLVISSGGFVIASTFGIPEIGERFPAQKKVEVKKGSFENTDVSLI